MYLTLPLINTDPYIIPHLIVNESQFSFKETLIGIAIAVIIVHLGFLFLSNYLNKKIGQEKILKIKTVFEYALIAFIVYFVFF